MENRILEPTGGNAIGVPSGAHKVFDDPSTLFNGSPAYVFLHPTAGGMC
jgi:hypothetical protein